MDIDGKNYSVIRFGSSYQWDIEAFNESLDVLKEAEHDVETSFDTAPRIVSCITAVRFIISQALHIDAPILSLQNITHLPYLLQRDYGAKCISVKNIQTGDLIFYFGDLILTRIQQRQCIKHVGIAVNKDGTFYHSTLSGGGYTISDVFQRIREGRIATTQQLLENR